MFRKCVAILCALCLMSISVLALAETKQGTASGFGGDVVVVLTVADGVITDCQIEASGETPAIGGVALETLKQQVLEANGAEIDGVSGATVTSEGVKLAVAMALNDADGEKKAMTPGTYTASYMGVNDLIEVEVTVTEEAIEAVTVTFNQETPGIGSPLLNKDGETCGNGGLTPIDLLPAEIVNNQTLAVDSVTGATITSKALIAAVTDAMVQAGADPVDWQQKPVAEEIAVEHEADVVIIGGGGAGLSAAISAGQKGAKVILVEKNGVVGGNSLVCGAQYNTWDPEGQASLAMSDSIKSTIESAIAEEPVSEAHAALIAEVKAEWEAFQAENKSGMYDSAAWYALQTWNGGDKVADLNLVRTFANNAYDGFQWLKPMGMEFLDTVGQAAGALWERSHTSKMNMGTGFISTYLDTIAAMDNVTVYVNMKGEELIVDENGKVSGVICVDENGNRQEFVAKNGVVMATGGYSANGDMVQEYNTSGYWDDLSKVPTTNRYNAAQGDGITMGIQAGAATRDMERIQLLFLGNLVDGGLTKYPARCVTGVVQTVFVNKEGNRFVREDGRRDEICKAILSQTDKSFYIVESADGSQYTDINDPAWRSADGFTREYLEKNGYIFVADTVEELAGKLGIDPAVLKATIDNYNACADVGTDAEFGRTNFACKLEHGPFVATPRQACIHHTMGGLVIDTQTHVLNADGQIIEGLYAAGEITGGLHGSNRLGGNAVTDIVVFGKLAGEMAADAK